MTVQLNQPIQPNMNYVKDAGRDVAGAVRSTGTRLGDEARAESLDW